jgi:hypothetical protein
VNRVVAEGEIVGVRRGRAQNELGIGECYKFDGFARWLESREFAMPLFE